MDGHLQIKGSLLAGLFAALVAGFCGGFKPTPYNNYVLLADAFLHGHVSIAQPSAAIDALPYHGSYYVIEAPLPALLLMPFVAIEGLSTNQSLLGLALCGIAVGAAYRLTEVMRLALPSRVAVALTLFAGTDLFWCASLGDVWFLAHIASVAMTMLALRELSAERRPWLVALWACAAAEARFTMVLALPVYFAMLIWPPSFSANAERERDRPPLMRRLLNTAPAFIGVVASFVAAWIAYNRLRWGVPVDIGYTAWFHQDAAGSPSGSPFGLRYLPYELEAFFTALPQIAPAFPYVIAPITGLALEVTSPALLLALFARGERRLLLAMWSAAILTAIPSFLYYVDGYAQFGMRHALDFEPFLVVLLAAALRTGLRAWQTVLCAYSALASGWGVWYWHAVLGR
jgi:hypothetical protein